MKIFWLLGVLVIGISGALIIFALRYKNSEKKAGFSAAEGVVLVLIIWTFTGAYGFFS